MVPWPIAVLTLVYGAIATSSVAAMWRAAQGQVQQPLVWSGIWGGVSAILVIGLTLMRPWARVLAVWASLAMMLSALGMAGLALVQATPNPTHSLFATLVASLQLVIIRYLTRPHVKVWFASSGQVARWQSGQEHT